MAQTIKILFFASVREQMGCGELDVTTPLTVDTIDKLSHWLSEQNPNFRKVRQQHSTLLMAKNQQMSAATTKISDGDEIAFFPPVTGG